MSTDNLIQFLGAVLGILVALNELIKQIREWRGGSPELRLIRDQLHLQNNTLLDLIRSSNTALLRLAAKFGVRL